MVCYIFKLDDYYNTTKKYYHLFDGLFKYKKLLKTVVFEELKINSSSYRVERTRDIVSNDNIRLLLDFFDFSDVSIENKVKYECFFSKLYYCCYFKSYNSFSYYKDKIEELEKERNILYPCLILFKVFLYANMEMDMETYNNILSKDFELLSSFYNTNYFTDDFRFVYLAMLFFFNIIPNKNAKILDEMKSLCCKIPKLSWLCYNVQASNAFLKSYDNEAITYFVQLVSEFKENNNMIRYFQIINNLALEYNIINEYECSLRYTSNVIEYLFSSTEYEKWIKYILTHYLYSHLMLKRYYDILNFLRIIIFDKKYLSDISATICFIAMNETNSFDLFDDIDFVAKNFKYYNIVKKYYKSLEVEHLDDLGNKPYPYGLRIFLSNIK